LGTHEHLSNWQRDRCHGPKPIHSDFHYVTFAKEQISCHRGESGEGETMRGQEEGALGHGVPCILMVVTRVDMS
jgi:hypothetical protein